VYRTHQHGSLALVTDLPEKADVDRELKLLDPRLFSELQIDVHQRPVWTVNLELGDVPPQLVFEYRDEDGVALPLSYKAVDRIRVMMLRGPLDVAAIVEANRALRERREAESAERYREIAVEFAEREHRSYLLPRSQALRMARDKSRENR